MSAVTVEQLALAVQSRLTPEAGSLNPILDISYMWYLIYCQLHRKDCHVVNGLKTFLLEIQIWPLPETTKTFRL